MTREDQWIKRIEQQDINAVDELVEDYYPEILRYCLWHAPNKSLADDAAQETFLKVIRYADRYTHKGKFRPFLYRIAANTCVDLWRKEREQGVSLEEMTQEPVYEDPEQAAMELRQLVRGLPEELQEVEAASWFSATKLLLAQLAVIGVGDLLLLAGVFLTAMVRTSIQAGNITLYLLLPFLIISAADLYMMGHCSGSSFFVGSVTLGAVMILLAVGLPGRWLPLFQQSMTLSWTALFGILLAKGTTEELIRLEDGKVWAAQIPMNRLSEYESKLLIANLHNEENGNITIRYLADEPYIVGSVPVTPHLEDLYLWLFPQETAERR